MDYHYYWFVYQDWANVPIDVNHDNVNEVVLTKYFAPTKIKVYDGASGNILYQNTYTGYSSGYTNTLDIDGDGYIEIVLVIYAGSPTYEYKLIIISTTSTAIGIESNSSKVKDFDLRQNYPNPFNPSTTIEYSIAKRSDVQILIYNETGQLVQTLDEGEKRAGEYKVFVDGTNLASGVYFYQIVLDNTAEAKKMILLK
jgi:hypothetical protein